MQPVKGAMKSGAKGFVKGFGKGLVGAVAQPVSGAVGMMSHMAGASGSVRETRKNSLAYLRRSIREKSQTGKSSFS